MPRKRQALRSSMTLGALAEAEQTKQCRESAVKMSASTLSCDERGRGPASCEVDCSRAGSHRTAAVRARGREDFEGIACSVRWGHDSAEELGGSLRSGSRQHASWSWWVESRPGRAIAAVGRARLAEPRQGFAALTAWTAACSAGRSSVRHRARWACLRVAQAQHLFDFVHTDLLNAIATP